MKNRNIVKYSFLGSIGITIVGAFLKIIHIQAGDTLLFIGLIAAVIFIMTAIYEVRSSKKIGRSEKALWTISLLFFSGIAGIVYLIIGRKRIRS